MDKSALHVAVIGGGCAGLSTAKALVDLGYQVTVYEASSQFGGRARMVMVENNQQMTMLDNGQHILLGAYHETLSLLADVDLKEEEAFYRVPLKMRMLSNLVNKPFILDTDYPVKAPYHLLKGLLKAEGLSVFDRLKAILMMRKLQKKAFQLKQDIQLEDFLRQHKQSDRIINVLWEPLCLAALNTPLSIASTQVFLNVLHDSFVGEKSNSDFLLPKLDLSQVLANPVSQYIFKKGGQLKLSNRVRKLEVELNAEGLEHFKIESKSGEHYYSHVVLATSAARIDKIIHNIPKLNGLSKQLSQLTFQPIYTVYIQYPKEVTLPEKMIGMTDATSQWIFDRGQLCNQSGLVAVIISAEGLHQNLSQEDLALEVINELYQCFDDLPKPLWYKVIAEKRATYTCQSNLSPISNKTMQPRLFLAGDYTYQAYPATIESAVRSGNICAKLVDESTQYL